MTGTAQIIRGDARHLPLADDSVDLVVTSPPYFALRSYQDGGEHYAGQIGDEATPSEFVDALLEVTRECVRVLKPSGSLWVNLGDKYANAAASGTAGHRSATGYFGEKWDGVGSTIPGIRTDNLGVRTKSLIGIPWRYAIRCIDELGLILRAEVVWSKPNGLPESVTDRVRRSHEQWFHFTLQPRYYSAVDEIREEYEPSSLERRRYSTGMGDALGTDGKSNGPLRSAREPGLHTTNPLGKLPGSVWTIPTEPLIVPPELGVDHFAAFPTEWPRRIIQGWSPAGVCVECGEGRRPVVHRKPMQWRPGPKAGGYETEGTTRVIPTGTMLAPAETTITGYACACPEPEECSCAMTEGSLRSCAVHGEESNEEILARYERGLSPTRPAVVLDPFGGTGTTALVAKALGRTGISVDMSADYCRLAEWRTNDPAQLAKAARKPYTPSVKPIEGQSDLLDLLAEEEAS